MYHALQYTVMSHLHWIVRLLPVTATFVSGDTVTVGGATGDRAMEQITMYMTTELLHEYPIMYKASGRVKICYQPGSTVMKSSLAEVPLKNRFSAVTDTFRFSQTGKLGASTVLVGWSTVALNTAEVLLLTSTKYLKVWFPPGGIPVAFSIKAIQEMIAVTGVVSSDSMTADSPLGALGDSE